MTNFQTEFKIFIFEQNYSTYSLIKPGNITRISGILTLHRCSAVLAVRLRE